MGINVRKLRVHAHEDYGVQNLSVTAISMVRRSVCLSPTRCCDSPPAALCTFNSKIEQSLGDLLREDSFWRNITLSRIFRLPSSLGTSLHPAPDLPGAFKSPSLFLSLHHLRPCLPRKRRRRPSRRRRRLLRIRQAFAPTIRLERFTDSHLPDLWHEEREPSRASQTLLSIPFWHLSPQFYYDLRY